MVNAMSSSQAKSLFKNLNVIEPNDEFKDFISQWRTEGLNEKPQRSIGLLQNQEMGM